MLSFINEVILNHIKVQLKEGNSLIYNIDIIKVGFRSYGLSQVTSPNCSKGLEIFR